MRAAPVALVVGALLSGGCALIAGYDFGSYELSSSSAGGSSTATTTTGTGSGGATSSSGTASSGGTGGATSSSSSTASSGGTGGGVVDMPVVLHTDVDTPNGLAADATTLYWTTAIDPLSPDGKVNRIEKDGTGFQTLVTGETFPLGIAVDATHAYWYAITGSDGIVKRTLKTGGAASVLDSAVGNVGGLAVQSATLYFTGFDYVASLPTSGGVPADVLVAGQNNPSGIAADASGIYWLESGNLNQGNGTVMRADLLGANVKALATGQEYPRVIAAAGGRIYWATLDGGLFSVDTDGANLFTYEPPIDQPCTSIAVDATHVYFTRGDGIFRTPIGLVSVQLLASGLDSPLSLVLDADTIYFTTSQFMGPGSVMKLAKAP